LSSIPSSITTARRTSSRLRLMSVASVSAVRATKARETADFEVERDLALTLGRAHARTADRHAAGPEGDRARLVAVAGGAAAGVVLALRADDLLDLGLHQLVEDAEPDAHRQRHESLLGRSGQLSKRLLHPLGQLLAGVLGGRDLSWSIRSSSAVPPRLVGLGRARQALTGAGRGGRTAAFKFYGLRDMLVTASASP